MTGQKNAHRKALEARELRALANGTKVPAEIIRRQASIAAKHKRGRE